MTFHARIAAHVVLMIMLLFDELVRPMRSQCPEGGEVVRYLARVKGVPPTQNKSLLILSFIMQEIDEKNNDQETFILQASSKDQ